MTAVGYHPTMINGSPVVIHALVAAHKRARTEGNQVLLVIGGAAVRRILSITGLDIVIPAFPDLEQALDQASAAP